MHTSREQRVSGEFPRVLDSAVEVEHIDQVAHMHQVAAVSDGIGIPGVRIDADPHAESCAQRC